jgi:hypothetical protein
MRNFLTVLIVLTCVTLIGQKLEVVSNYETSVIKSDIIIKPHNDFEYRTFGTTWFNLQNDLFDLFVLDPNSSAVSSFPIFPDSTIYKGINSSDVAIVADLHGAGDIINPSKTPSNWIDSWGEVIIDSIAIFKGYTRNTESSIIDTLFINFIKSSNSLGFLDFNDNDIPDQGEFSLQPIFYDYTVNRITSNQIIRTDTVLLTEDDSSEFATYTLLNVNDTVKGGDRYGIYLRFQPGYTWNENNDTLSNYNAFFIMSREQETGKYPEHLWAIDAGFCSYVLDKQVRYNQAGSGNGSLSPVVIFTDAWPYEHHDISYKLSSNELGIKNVNLNVSGVGTYPNPAASKSTVSFTLEQRDEVVMNITDLSGRVIESFNLGDFSSGEHITQIDVSKYNNGNYILSVNGSSKIITVLH